MADERPPRTGGLVVDLAPAQAFAAALDAVAEAWAAVPPAQRATLTRLVWLHPSGEVVVYQAPDGPKVEGEGGG